MATSSDSHTQGDASLADHPKTGNTPSLDRLGPNHVIKCWNPAFASPPLGSLTWFYSVSHAGSVTKYHSMHGFRSEPTIAAAAAAVMDHPEVRTEVITREAFEEIRGGGV